MSEGAPDVGANDTFPQKMAREAFRQRAMPVRVPGKDAPTKQISRAAFKSLVTELLTQAGNNDHPTDKDLDEAFKLADEDASGQVDEQEFIHLFQYIAEGEVHGISKKSMFSSSAKKKEAMKNDIKKEKILSNLNTSFNAPLKEETKEEPKKAVERIKAPPPARAVAPAVNSTSASPAAQKSLSADAGAVSRSDNPAMQKAVKTFQRRAETAKNGTKVMSRATFKSVVSELLMEAGNHDHPTDKDFDEAFKLADEDGSGKVDEREFLHLFDLVASGQVHGIGKTSMFGSSASTKKKEAIKLALKKEKILTGLDNKWKSTEKPAVSSSAGAGDEGDLDDELGTMPKDTSPSPEMWTESASLQRRTLVRFYEENAPDKLADVDKFLDRFMGREEKMWVGLETKYGLEKIVKAKAKANKDSMPMKKTREIPEKPEEKAELPAGKPAAKKDVAAVEVKVAAGKDATLSVGDKEKEQLNRSRDEGPDTARPVPAQSMAAALQDGAKESWELKLSDAPAAAKAAPLMAEKAAAKAETSAAAAPAKAEDATKPSRFSFTKGSTWPKKGEESKVEESAAPASPPVSEDGKERRVDPEDPTVFATQEEFFWSYGGYNEWEAAPVHSLGSGEEERKEEEREDEEAVEEKAAAEKAEKQRQAKLKREAEEEAEYERQMAEIMALSAGDGLQIEEEAKLMDERRADYLRATYKILDETVPPALRLASKYAGKPVTIVPIARDGNCVPRAALSASLRAAGDGPTQLLRGKVVATIQKERRRFMLPVLEGPPEPAVRGMVADMSQNAQDAAKFFAHCKRMGSAGTFFEEPEFQALADVLGSVVVVDAVVAKCGDASRRVFEPAARKALPPLPPPAVPRRGLLGWLMLPPRVEPPSAAAVANAALALPPAPVIHLYLSVAAMNASHCEAVVSADDETVAATKAAAARGENDAEEDEVYRLTAGPVADEVRTMFPKAVARPLLAGLRQQRFDGSLEDLARRVDHNFLHTAVRKRVGREPGVGVTKEQAMQVKGWLRGKWEAWRAARDEAEAVEAEAAEVTAESAAPTVPTVAASSELGPVRGASSFEATAAGAERAKAVSKVSARLAEAEDKREALRAQMKDRERAKKHVTKAEREAAEAEAERLRIKAAFERRLKAKKDKEKAEIVVAGVQRSSSFGRAPSLGRSPSASSPSPVSIKVPEPALSPGHPLVRGGSFSLGESAPRPASFSLGDSTRGAAAAAGEVRATPFLSSTGDGPLWFVPDKLALWRGDIGAAPVTRQKAAVRRAIIEQNVRDRKQGVAPRPPPGTAI